MKNDIIKGLISVANSLDSKGFGKEADQLDRIMRKFSQQQSVTSGADAASADPGDLFLDTGATVGQFQDLLKEKPNTLADAFTGILMSRFGERELRSLPKEEQIDTIAEVIDAANSFKTDLTAGAGKEAYLDLVRQRLGMEVVNQNYMGGQCAPNGKPLIRLPGDNTYGYQLTEDGTGFMAWTLKDCKSVANGRVFKDPGGLEKVKNAVTKAAPSETPSEPSRGPEVTDATIDEMPVNPNADSIAALQNLRGRVAAMEETRRFEQDKPTVQEAQRLLGIKTITPLAPGVRRKHLLKLIDKGIAKLQGNSADDLFMSEAASRSNDRISKFASLLSGEFGGLDKKVRR